MNNSTVDPEVYQFEINKLSAISPEWQRYNICRTEATKFNGRFPIAGRTYFGPHDMPDDNGGRCLKVLWNFVGKMKVGHAYYHKFIVKDSDYGLLLAKIQDGGIRIDHKQIARSGSCPWWYKVTLDLRVPSDRFLTIHGDVVEYDQIADQLELF